MRSRGMLTAMVRVVLCVVCWVLYPLGQALALPAPNYSVSLEGIEVATSPGTYLASDELGSIQAVPQPSIHAHVNGTGTSIVQVQYFFRVDGPANNLTVPITITGRIAIEASGAEFAQNKIWGVTAQLIAQSYNGQFGSPLLEEIDHQLATVDCNPNGEGPVPSPPPIGTCAAPQQEKEVVLTLSTRTGADNSVVLNAAANNREPRFVSSFDSLVDPIISFAPGFDPTGYTIVFSDGIGNSAPEPSSTALLGLFLGCVPLARVRKSE